MWWLEGPLQTDQVIKAIKGCSGELDFSISDSTFLANISQGIKQLLCRWLQFSLWAPVRALKKCWMLALTSENPHQTQMLCPLKEPHPWPATQVSIMSLLVLVCVKLYQFSSYQCYESESKVMEISRETKTFLFIVKYTPCVTVQDN